MDVKNEPSMEMPFELIRDVSWSDYAILTPEDRERFIMTLGISVCKGLCLHFPENGIVALAHMKPRESIEPYLSKIRSDLGHIDESPSYFFRKGPFAGYDLDYSPIMKMYFGARPHQKVIYKNIQPRDDSFSIVVDKETGIFYIHGRHSDVLKI
ncbi:MAG: hypothetical protein HYW24_04815 [Candidatus Aenigmarchaeota archaeon]|nr:hypothetical protein [Candidatus Aenigmarchaeota archaeon]